VIDTKDYKALSEHRSRRKRRRHSHKKEAFDDDSAAGSINDDADDDVFRLSAAHSQTAKAHGNLEFVLGTTGAFGQLLVTISHS